jgi:electron transfer flavoprotein beta subunit
MIAGVLDIPSITFAKQIQVEGNTVRVQRQTEAGYDDVECSTPALVSVTAGVVEPRYPSFKGIMAAKKKPVEELDLAALGIDSGVVGKNGARQETVRITDAEERQAGEVIEDEGDAHEKIVEFLGELKVV